MRRFFFDPNMRSGDRVILSEEESRHISKVLRLEPGTAVELLDGKGAVYSATILETGRKTSVCIEGIVTSAETLHLPLIVKQGVLKGEKMDTVVQKCTELGVSHMSPFWSSRCQGKLNEIQKKKKHERWQRIGLAACKQCLRPTLMQLDTIVTYADCISADSGEEKTLRLLFWEEEQETHLREIPDLGQFQSIEILLGPEGGFTQEEVLEARDQGWITVSLGKRILRAETATLTAVSIVQYLSGSL